MTIPERPSRAHHITLTVSDLDRSVEWYQRVLGPASLTSRSGEGWQRVRMSWPDGLILGVTAHDGTEADATFDETHIGLDHLGLECMSEQDVRAWACHLDDVQATRGPVESVAYGWAVTARDPDGIAIEFFCPTP